jgi:glucose/arabinose dehydrogenase
MLAGAMVLACAAEAGPTNRGATIQIRRVDNGATTGRLTFITHAPNDYTRLFIVDKSGIIYIKNLKNGVFNATPYLDITSLVNDGDNAQGLLGLAFDPDYETNGYFYVDFTNNVGNTEIRRYQRDGSNPDLATTVGSIVILRISQPFTNHNGGWIGFSPNDGYLYISTGDGGSACDPSENAQNIDALLGKILRIDEDGDDFPADPNKNYSIPAGNPFVGVAGADEIWAMGMRNPWRCGFDRVTGDLWIGDVGQDAQEEFDMIPDGVGGRNFGWDCREGTGSSNAPNSFCGADVNCGAMASFTEPLYSYSHITPPAGVFVCAITGGYVYRGCAIPSEYGHYFFVDYCAGRFNSYDGVSVTDRTSEWTPDVGSISVVTSFGEDAWGELYFGEDNSGEVYRMEPVIPRRVADVNCDTVVNVADLFLLLSEWGNCIGCKSDLNGDDVVDVTDLFILLADWG